MKELNYVTQRRDPISQKYEEPESAEGTLSIFTALIISVVIKNIIKLA